MSKSTLKLKHLEILNLNLYFQRIEDDLFQDEEDIIDVVYEQSEYSKFIFKFIILLSNGSIIYFTYNSTTRKVIEIIRNTVLRNIITNDINLCEISFNLPIILSTSLNEIIYLESKEKDKEKDIIINKNNSNNDNNNDSNNNYNYNDLIQISEENILISSNFCESQIINMKFNCSRNIILITTINQFLIYKIQLDKFENKQNLNFICEIKLPGLNPKLLNFQEKIDYTLINKFSFFNENIIYFCYTTENKIQDEFQNVYLETEDNIKDKIFCNFVKVKINKKDFTLIILVRI
jgi:hypothetical protein